MGSEYIAELIDDLNEMQKASMKIIMRFEAEEIEEMWGDLTPWNTLLTFEKVKGEGSRGEITDIQVSNVLTRSGLLHRKERVLKNIEKVRSRGSVDIKKAMEKWVELFYEDYFVEDLMEMREAADQEIFLLEKLFKWADRKGNPSGLSDGEEVMLETIRGWTKEKRVKFGLIVIQMKKMAEYHYNFGWTFDVLKEYLASASSIIQKRFRAYKEGTLTRKSLGIFTGSKEVKKHDWEELKKMMEGEGFTGEEIEDFHKNHYIARAGEKRKKTKVNKKKKKKKKEKKKNTKKKNKGNSTKKVQRGGVCPCAIPLYTTIAPYAAMVASAAGLYSLEK